MGCEPLFIAQMLYTLNRKESMSLESDLTEDVEEIEVKKHYDLDPHESVAIKFVEIVNELHDLEKKRKKDYKISETVSAHLADMLKGSENDIILLDKIVTRAKEQLCRSG